MCRNFAHYDLIYLFFCTNKSSFSWQQTAQMGNFPAQIKFVLLDSNCQPLYNETWALFIALLYVCLLYNVFLFYVLPDWEVNGFVTMALLYFVYCSLMLQILWIWKSHINLCNCHTIHLSFFSSLKYPSSCSNLCEILYDETSVKHKHVILWDQCNTCYMMRPV